MPFAHKFIMVCNGTLWYVYKNTKAAGMHFFPFLLICQPPLRCIFPYYL